MSLKRFCFDRNIKICRTCMFIDEYAFNVNDTGKIPCGYDGTAICGIYEIGEKETSENRLIISPAWPPCKKYKRCTERQADYLDIFDEETKTIVTNPNPINNDDN